MKLQESLGISSGLKDLTLEINNIITDFAVACKRGAALNKVKQIFSYNSLSDNIKIEYDKKEKIYSAYLWFKLDPAYNKTKWLSNDTMIEVYIFSYDLDHVNYGKNIGIRSNYTIEDNQVVGHIELYLDTHNTFGDLTYRLGNYIVDLKNPIPFVSLLQHEFNHLHKNKIISTVEFSNAYDRLMQLIQMKSYTGNFAYALYKYCVKDEKCAHVEQFYKEYDFKSFNSSEIYRDAINDYKFFYSGLNFIEHEKKETVYKNLKTICEIIFNITANNADIFFEKLIEFILKNIDDTIKRMQRAAKQQNLDEACSLWDKKFKNYSI